MSVGGGVIYKVANNRDWLDLCHACAHELADVLDYFMEDTEQACVSTYLIKYPRDMHTLFFSGGTNYDFGKYGYSLTVIYNSEECGLIQPSFTYVPDFLNRQLSFKLSYSNVFGSDYAYPFGLMKEKDMVILTTQFSFPG